MIALENEVEDEKLLCVDCLTKNQKKIITVEEAN